MSEQSGARTKSTDYRIAERKLRDKLTAKDKGETHETEYMYNRYA